MSRQTTSICWTMKLPALELVKAFTSKVCGKQRIKGTKLQRVNSHVPVSSLDFPLLKVPRNKLAQVLHQTWTNSIAALNWSMLLKMKEEVSQSSYNCIHFLVWSRSHPVLFILLLLVVFYKLNCSALLHLAWLSKRAPLPIQLIFHTTAVQITSYCYQKQELLKIKPYIIGNVAKVIPPTLSYRRVFRWLLVTLTKFLPPY